MASKLTNLKCDVSELYRLSELTERRRVKDILTIEAKKIETEISFLQENEPVTKSSINPQVKRVYNVKLTSYGWDQNEDVIKIFVSLPKVETLPLENINCNFTESSFELEVKELDNRNYTLSVKNLYSSINTAKCSWKVKTGQIILSLSKLSSTNWSNLTKNDNMIKCQRKVFPTTTSGELMANLNLIKKKRNDFDAVMFRFIMEKYTKTLKKKINISPKKKKKVSKFLRIDIKS
ncbi:hypothetical protein PGB90_003570 [Kerria lacca]